ncbi:MAG: FecR domain-containing protein [Leptospiraceae bacterium]|nr:FecR domain-containing protein [Leptospiraceae bacterium]MCB1317174.1 FecR domain-containing protein [Leptospiraceae bacterium]
MTAGLVLSLAMVFVANCGEKQESATGARSMIIVYTSQDAKIVRDGTEIPAKVGMVVKENDVIQTTNGKVDLQTRNGSAVRIREYTTVTVANLYGEGNGDTTLRMEHGGIMASVKRTDGQENFSVVTPTAIAGVRGTTFTVESEEGLPTRVKVLDGRVAMKPRVAALESASEEEIQQDEELSQLSDLAQQQEVIIEPESEGTLDEAVEAKVQELNAKYEDAQADEAQRNEVEQTSVVELRELMTTEEKPAVIVTRAEITTEEVTEQRTLERATIDETLVSRVESGDQEAIEQMQREREQRQGEILDQIAEEAESRGLKSEEQIREHYNKLETIHLHSGEDVIGAVIAQTGDQLVVHTPQGVRRINTSDVEYQAPNL